MISSKLPNVGISIFSEMTKMANKYSAINLSQGFPGFNCSERLIELVNKYMNKGLNQYAPMEGVLQLREKIVEKTEFLYGHKYDTQKEVTVTAGATQAIYTAISAFVKEKDEVIVFEPAFDCYVPAILINGGYPVYIQLKPPYYRIDWEEVRKAVSSRTRMIIINTPHNPTGMVMLKDDFEHLQKIAGSSRIIVLSDEVYEHIVFDGLKHNSVSMFPGLVENSLVISSFGKTYHTTGWKIGYCLSPEKLMSEFRKVHQFIVYAVNTPIQYAYAEFLEEKENYLDLPIFYETKRNLFNTLLNESKFRIIPSQGTYYQLLNYSFISDEKDIDITGILTQNYGVTPIPLSVFYHENTDNKVLRFCFAKPDETLKEAAERLSRFKFLK